MENVILLEVRLRLRCNQRYTWFFNRCNFFFNLEEVDVDYFVNYKLENIEGDDYFAVDSATADFTCEKVYIDIKNILGDNKEMGESTFLLILFYLNVCQLFSSCEYS